LGVPEGTIARYPLFMSKTAFIFPGQGSQSVGMGRELWDAHEDVRRLYALAHELTGLDIAGVSFNGPQDELDKDLTAQLCVYVCNEAHRIEAVRHGAVPDAVTGYSLGFYSALTAAGSLSFEDGLLAVKKAGELALSKGKRGTMAAIIGLDLWDVEGLCIDARDDGGVWVSNVNAARQILISGSVMDVSNTVDLAIKRGALSAYTLKMGAAYHSPLMEGAVKLFSEYLAGVEFKRPTTKVLSYIDAKYLDEPGDIRDTVSRQLSARVLWKDSVMRLIKDGVDNFIEIGPGNALSRMVRWVDRGVNVNTSGSLLNPPLS
jgi:[acyl-carrier-protein] S-malonyltransferase